MKKNKVIIITLIAISILLISGGMLYSFNEKEPSDKEKTEEKEQETKPKDPNSPENYKITELESVITPDKKLRLGSTRVYEYDGLTGMMLNIIPVADFEHTYLKITMHLEKSKDYVVIHLEGLKKGVQVEREVQTLNDWSTLKKWSIEIITEDEANKIWESQKPKESTT